MPRFRWHPLRFQVDTVGSLPPDAPGVVLAVTDLNASSHVAPCVCCRTLRRYRLRGCLTYGIPNAKPASRKRFGVPLPCRRWNEHAHIALLYGDHCHHQIQKRLG